MILRQKPHKYTIYSFASALYEFVCVVCACVCIRYIDTGKDWKKESIFSPV